MFGLALALLSGLSFAFSNIFVRRGTVVKGESYSAVFVTSVFGLAIFFVAIAITGDIYKLSGLSLTAWLSLSAAGIVHFFIGRFLGFSGVRLIGANRAVPAQTIYIVIAAVLGVIFFGEPMTVGLILSLILVTGGVALISTTGSAEARKAQLKPGDFATGVAVTLGAAICWGVSPILTKIGLNEVGSPVLATFVSYLASNIFVAFTLLVPANRKNLGKLSRPSLVPFLISGLATSVAQILRYTAYTLAPVSLATPLVGTNSFLVFPLSFLINRDIEIFNLRIMVGAAAIITGVFLIFFAA